jgi:hypothetical protein
VTGPIFIGGLAFSGKTPLRMALNAHPRISVHRHAALWTRFHGRFGDLNEPSNLEHCLDVLLADEKVATLAPDRRLLERELSTGPVTDGRLFGLLLEQHALRLGKQRWGEQAQELEHTAAALFDAYPDARMIHMVRDPRTSPLLRREPDLRAGKLGWEAARWLDSAALALRNRRRFPERYRVVRLEALAACPELVLRCIAAFLEEDYRPEMVEALLDHPLLVGAAEPRDAAAPREPASFVEQCTRPALRALEYSVPAAKGGRAAAWVDRPLDTAGWLMGRAVHGRASLKGAW